MAKAAPRPRKKEKKVVVPASCMSVRFQQHVITITDGQGNAVSCLRQARWFLGLAQPAPMPRRLPLKCREEGSRAGCATLSRGQRSGAGPIRVARFAAVG
jgi:hypothetical protein